MSDNWLPVPLTPEPGSKWKHFKGGIYRILYVVRDCEDPNRFIVVYRNVEHGTIWAREHSNFTGLNDAGVLRFERMDD